MINHYPILNHIITTINRYCTTNQQCVDPMFELLAELLDRKALMLRDWGRIGNNSEDRFFGDSTTTTSIGGMALPV